MKEQPISRDVVDRVTINKAIKKEKVPFVDNNALFNPNEKTKILFLAANPNDQKRIQTDFEHQQIINELNLGEHRDRFKFLQPRFAVTISNLIRAMNDKPHIIHFSGHGLQKGIVVTKDQNTSQVVPIKALKRLFKPVKNITKCVILNSCYSAEQATEISTFGMFVIGYNIPVNDNAAISFAKGFYNGLGEGKSFQDAFNDAMIVWETESEQDSDIVEVWKDGQLLDL